jgi:hypothetical protein
LATVHANFGTPHNIEGLFEISTNLGRESSQIWQEKRASEANLNTDAVPIRIWWTDNLIDVWKKKTL